MRHQHGRGPHGSPTSATGTGWERTPWHATRRAAWEAISLLISASFESLREWWVTTDDAELDLLQLRMN
jgi:hypothetical protein